MCLKEWRTFTFSNRRAYSRALEKVEFNEDFVKCQPCGFFYVVEKYKGELPDKRDRLPYKILMQLQEAGTIYAKVIHFDNWTGLKKAKKFVGRKRNIFGKISVEMF
jgi:hypothetical protein